MLKGRHRNEGVYIKKIGKERLKNWYYNITYIMNRKYRKSLNEVKRNFRTLTEDKKEALQQCLLSHYYRSESLHSIQKQDLEDHLFYRLSGFRHRTIPWLNSIKALNRCKVLEIGCGTGCTTIALAEQGCNVTSIDVNEESIKVAQKRCELYGLPAKISALNATEINEIGEKFDFIIFPDSLEHMTYSERITALSKAWTMLNIDAPSFLVVIGTPNRLYFFDRHSSLLPFYDWLPDEIAMQYAKHSPRQECINSNRDKMTFLRFGRGASYHEFELALKTQYTALTAFDMWSFMQTPIFTKMAHRDEYKYMKLLKRLGPKDLPEGFYCEQLHIAIRKT